MRDFSAIEGIAPTFRNQPQSLAQVRVGKFLAQLRYPPARQKDALRFRGLAQLSLGAFPVALDKFGNRVALLRIVDRGREEILPGKAPEALMSLAPSFDGAGHRDAVDAVLRHGSDTLLFEVLDRKLARRPSAGIEAVQFAALGIPVKEEEVTANAVHHGLGDTQHGVGSDCGVHR